MLRKRGRIWYYQSKVNGKTFALSTGETKKRAAEKKVPELMRQAQLHREQPESSPRLFKAIADEAARIEIDVSRLQSERVACSLKNFAKWVGKDIDLTQINQKMLMNFMRHRVRQGRARSTIDKELTFVIRIVRAAGYHIIKPKMINAPYTRNRRFSDEELLAFFSEATDRFRIVWLILLATGGRLSDMVPSDHEHSNHKPVLKSEVHLDQRIIEIRSSKLKPNEQPVIRRVRFPDELLDVLEEQIQRTPKHYPYLFEKLWKPGRAFESTLKRAGLMKVTPQGKLTAHSFRATYLTKMGEALNNNAWLLKEIAGHKDIRTTQIYCQPIAPVVPLSLANLMPNSEFGDGKLVQMGVSDGCQSEKTA